MRRASAGAGAAGSDQDAAPCHAHWTLLWHRRPRVHVDLDAVERRGALAEGVNLAHHRGWCRMGSGASARGKHGRCEPGDGGKGKVLGTWRCHDADGFLHTPTLVLQCGKTNPWGPKSLPARYSTFEKRAKQMAIHRPRDPGTPAVPAWAQSSLGAPCTGPALHKVNARRAWPVQPGRQVKRRGGRGGPARLCESLAAPAVAQCHHFEVALSATRPSLTLGVLEQCHK